MHSNSHYKKSKGGYSLIDVLIALFIASTVFVVNVNVYQDYLVQAIINKNSFDYLQSVQRHIDEVRAMSESEFDSLATKNIHTNPNISCLHEHVPATNGIKKINMTCSYDAKGVRYQRQFPIEIHF